MRLAPSRSLAFMFATAVTLASNPGHAAEADYLSRYGGSFSGSGTVQKNAEDGPRQISCTFDGEPTATGVSISGQCGVGAFTKEVRADIRFDSATGRYSGTYVGASIGAAQLSGKRHGNSVVMTITWPRPVNGDTKATMTIRNDGSGRMAITVTDELTPGGPKSAVTQIALNQS